MARRAKKEAEPITTAQRLRAVIKACRDIMRKDKGLSGDVDRLPMLTWIMFLKFLDDMEQVRSDEAALQGKPFRPVIESPYRWRDWNPPNAASDASGLHNAITGDALTAFINQDEALRPDGERGPGLFAYLRSLAGGGGLDRADVIASVFRGTVNRMQSGYILRDVLDKVGEIHFSSSDEIHTLSHLYESLLRDMRDAAGDSGEFYTPRPVVEMIVKAIDPQPGEVVLDPAAGTGGFLVEAYKHLLPLVSTVEEYERLQRSTLFGIEAKPLPYLLCQMNLLLHGIEAPQIDPLNALRFRMSEIGDRDRVDVIVTNPPFGGEEEKGVQRNFPADRQTSETALLFLQLIMRKLRRPGHDGSTGGRAGVVVPNGTLSGSGVAARIKQDLIENYNLHTVVRLPPGVFNPYAPISTNVLFFDRSGPTRETWYYEHPLPEGRRNYTKTDPIEFDEFEPLIEWWANRRETERAWLVPRDRIVITNYNLDIANPRRPAALEHLPPLEVVGTILQRAKDFGRVLAELDDLVRDFSAIVEKSRADVTMTPMREIVTPRAPDVEVSPEESYAFAGVYSFGRGVFRGKVKSGSEISYKRLTRLRVRNFVYPKLMAWEGALGIVPPECDGLVVSTEFPVFEVDEGQVLPDVLDAYFRMPQVWPLLAGESRGTNVRRRRLHPDTFLAYEFPLPPHPVQEAMRDLQREIEALRRALMVDEVNALEPSLVHLAFRPPDTE